MRRILVTAAAAALLVLTATGCASTVAGQGSFDTAFGPGPSPSPTGDPSPTGTPDPTGDPGPTGDPSPTGSADPGAPAGGDQQAVASVAERWYHALAERDGATVCGLMTAEARRQTGSDCEKAVRDTDFSSSQRDAMRRIEVDPGKVVVSGDSARIPADAFSVDGQQSSSSGRLAAARSGGDWLIDGVG